MGMNAAGMDVFDRMVKNVLDIARSELDEAEYERFRDEYMAKFPETRAYITGLLTRKTERATIARLQLKRFERCCAEGRIGEWLEQSQDDAVIIQRFSDGAQLQDDPSAGGMNRVSLVYPDGSGLLYWVADGRIRAALSEEMAPFGVFGVIERHCRTLRQSWGRVPLKDIRDLVESVDIDLDKLLVRWNELYPENEALGLVCPRIEQFRKEFMGELAFFGPDPLASEDDELGDEPDRGPGRAQEDGVPSGMRDSI